MFMALNNWLSISYAKNRTNIPRVSCCYAIFINEKLVYIGSTWNLKIRFCEHKIRYGYGNEIITPWADFPNSSDIKIKYRPSKKYGDWAMIEMRLIRKLKPVFNTKLKGRKNAFLPT